MAKYRNDPRWITVKYPVKAHNGAVLIPAGARALYYPLTKTFLVGDAAEEAWRRFESEAADEAFTTGNWS